MKPVMKLQVNSLYFNRVKGGRKRKKKHRKNKGHHSKKQSFNNSFGLGFSLSFLIGATVAAIVWFVHRRRSMKAKKKHPDEVPELQALQVDSN